MSQCDFPAKSMGFEPFSKVGPATLKDFFLNILIIAHLYQHGPVGSNRL